MVELNAYMASNDCGIVNIIPVENSMSVNEQHNLTAYLVPYSAGQDTPGKVSVNMLQLGKDPYTDLPVDPEALAIVQNAEDPERYDVNYQNPVINGDKWIRTTVMIDGTGVRNFTSAIDRTSGPGPVSSFFADVITPAGPFTAQLTTNTVVPGELLFPKWEFQDGYGAYHVYDNRRSGKYFKTVYLTGGVIKEKLGDYEDFDLKFLVTIEGADIQCRPSDFIQWEVGDWVFLANANPLIPEWVILPLQINGKGA